MTDRPHCDRPAVYTYPILSWIQNKCIQTWFSKLGKLKVTIVLIQRCIHFQIDNSMAFTNPNIMAVLYTIHYALHSFEAYIAVAFSLRHGFGLKFVCKEHIHLQPEILLWLTWQFVRLFILLVIPAVMKFTAGTSKNFSLLIIVYFFHCWKFTPFI